MLQHDQRRIDIVIALLFTSNEDSAIGEEEMVRRSFSLADRILAYDMANPGVEALRQHEDDVIALEMSANAFKESHAAERTARSDAYARNKVLFDMLQSMAASWLEAMKPAEEPTA